MQEISVIDHHFIGGVYNKHMVIPEGHRVVSHKHNYDHMSILVSGVVSVEENGIEEIHTAPAVIEIKAGVSHAVTPVTGYGNAVWMCIHATDETDKDLVDNVLIQRIQHMEKMHVSFDTRLALSELDKHPELWDKFPFRTRLLSDSPHREVNDIILRYREISALDHNHPEKFSEQHESIWYEAMEFLPAIRSIINDVMRFLPSHAKLGGCLITKIPPGKQVYPHSDTGQWHPEFYNKKILILLQSAEGQSFNFENESHVGFSGEVFSFDNAPIHWVINNSSVDRISLILAVRDIKEQALCHSLS